MKKIAGGIITIIGLVIAIGGINQRKRVGNAC